MNLLTAGILLFLTVAAVLVFGRIAAKRSLNARERISDADLLKLFGPISLPPETILCIVREIGESYGISYARLRPTDCLVTELSKVDSWRFDAGAEKLEKALREKHAIILPEGLKSLTIIELLRMVESAHTQAR